MPHNAQLQTGRTHIDSKQCQDSTELMQDKDIAESCKQASKSDHAKEPQLTLLCQSPVPLIVPLFDGTEPQDGETTDFRIPAEAQSTPLLRPQTFQQCCECAAAHRWMPRWQRCLVRRAKHAGAAASPSRPLLSHLRPAHAPWRRPARSTRYGIRLLVWTLWCEEEVYQGGQQQQLQQGQSAKQHSAT